MNQNSPILDDVEAFLKESNMSATAFGMGALGDPKFVPQLREGRRLWPETVDKVRSFMTAHSPVHQ